MKAFLFIITFLLSLTSFAAQRNLIAVGKGISSPATTGFGGGLLGRVSLGSNPAGINLVNGVKASGLVYTPDGETEIYGTGIEAAFGNETMGLAVNYMTYDCTNCDDQLTAGVNLVFGDFVSVGISADEDDYRMGLIFNPKGDFRFGLIYGDYDPNAEVGLGLSYYVDNWSLVLDATKTIYETKPSGTLEGLDEIIYLTPGFKFHIDRVYFSVNHDTGLNVPENLKSNGNTWLGVGFGHGDPINVSLYYDYFGDWTASITAFF